MPSAVSLWQNGDVPIRQRQPHVHGVWSFGALQTQQHGHGDPVLPHVRRKELFGKVRLLLRWGLLFA